MDTYRMTSAVHKEFHKLLEMIRNDYTLANQDLNNQVVSIRNEITGLIEKAEKEYVAMKKYNILIDLLSKENERIILNNIETPYWLNGEIEQERPPGITYQEFQKLSMAISDKFRNFREGVRWHEIPDTTLSNGVINLEIDISRLIADAFCIPNKNLKFTKGLYDRSIVNNPFFRQNTPCEICDENRTIDSCHIIPNHLGGELSPGNVLYLCPTHHRLFDRFMLSKEEYVKINWQSKSKAAANFAYIVFRPIFEETWRKIENGIFEKAGDLAQVYYGKFINTIELMILDMVNESEGISIKEISKRMDINQTECKKIIKIMESKGRLKISGKGGNFKMHPVDQKINNPKTNDDTMIV